MITFKQFLSERAENMRAYRKIFRSNKDARVGFEIEVFIPSSHEFATPGPKEKGRDSIPLRRFDTLSEFEDYFIIDRYALHTIDRDYEDWKEEKRQDFINDRLDDDNDKDSLSDEFDDIADEEYSWTKWFEDAFKNAYDFVNTYDLEPRYGWAEENDKNSAVYTEEEPEISNNWKTDIGQLISDTLRKYLKKTVEWYDSPGHASKNYAVVPDSSINGGETEKKGYGAEIVSPPLPIDEAFADLDRVFSFIEDYELETNSSTGLHINLSIPGIYGKLDPAKLVLLMGDRHVLQQFNRASNSMTRSQMRVVQGTVDAALKSGKMPAQKSEVWDLLQAIGENVMKSGKYASVNLDKLKDGYLEFRAAGNVDYHKRLEDVQNLVGRWLSAIDSACDPEKDKEFYLKQLSKVFDEVAPIKQDEDLVTALMKFAPFAKQLPTRKGDEFISTLLMVAEKVGAAAPTFAQIKELRMLMKSAGVAADQIISKIDDGHDRKEITYFLKSFKLV